MPRLRITLDDRVLYDHDIPGTDGVRFNRTTYTPKDWDTPGQATIELRAATDGVTGYDSKWEL